MATSPSVQLALLELVRAVVLACQVRCVVMCWWHARCVVFTSSLIHWCLSGSAGMPGVLTKQ